MLSRFLDRSIALTPMVVFMILAGGTVAAQEPPPYTVVDTGQKYCYSEWRQIRPPRPGMLFFGQDAQYVGKRPSYRDNGDGTVNDLNTGLMWSKGVSLDKVSLEEAQAQAKVMTLAEHTDWRVPTIKDLYSLIDFSGNTGRSLNGLFGGVPDNAIPFIDTDYLDFEYGLIDQGERYIDAQWLSSTKYVSTTMNGMDTLFGVNFADGRIKGYGYRRAGSSGPDMKKFFVRYVRGAAYGKNDFVDNGDGTITDRATGLEWMQADSGRPMSWRMAFLYAAGLDFAGHDDWRLPNIKELQSIVDYTRSPDTTDSPAIDPVFRTTPIINEARQRDFPFFWSSTTHMEGETGTMACYVAFGRGLGTMNGVIMDVHGAGAQRSDPKVGVPGLGFGPQGDARRIYNFVRCVRGGGVTRRSDRRNR